MKNPLEWPSLPKRLVVSTPPIDAEAFRAGLSAACVSEMVYNAAGKPSRLPKKLL